VRLAEYTDHSLRVLMYCARQAGRRVSVAELAQSQGLARNAVMKIVADLARAGLLDTVRGRGGGVRLARPARQIRVGEVVRLGETDFRIAACFDPAGGGCPLAPGCRLQALFAGALRAYLDTLDRATLADIAGLEAPAPADGPPPRPGPARPRPRAVAGCTGPESFAPTEMAWTP
jgi:Rrf2 family nitric oxide-sensitive transcriptional repressor